LCSWEIDARYAAARTGLGTSITQGSDAPSLFEGRLASLVQSCMHKIG
jgi:hypothetical protein